MAKRSVGARASAWVAVAFGTATLLSAANPTNAANALFRAKRTWWFSQAGSWTAGHVTPPAGTPPYLYEPPAVAYVGETADNPRFTAPRSFIKNTTYTFMCGTFGCYIGYPYSSGWYSYWNAKGSFRKSNPYAPTTTTTVRMRTVNDQHTAGGRFTMTVQRIVLTGMGKYARTVTVVTPPPTAMYTIDTPTPGGCVVNGGTITTPADCPGTTQFGGAYARSRGGSIMIWPGGNRFGGTLRFLVGPNQRYFKYSFGNPLFPYPYTLTYTTPPLSEQLATGVEIAIGEVTQSAVGLQYRLTDSRHYHLVVGTTSMGGPEY